MEKVAGDLASWRAGGGAQAARALRLTGHSWARLACVDSGGHVGPCRLPAGQGSQVPKTEGAGDLGPLTWTPWEAVEVKVVESCPRLWPSRSSGPVLAEKVHVFPPLALSESLPFTDILGALEPSSSAGARTCQTQPFPDFPNQGPRESQTWLLWISATVTWK